MGRRWCGLRGGRGRPRARHDRPRGRGGGVCIEGGWMRVYIYIGAYKHAMA